MEVGNLNPLFHEIFQKTRFLNKELNQVLKEYNLFASQWTVIYCIYKHGDMTLTEIWRYLNVEAPTVTRTVNRLVELGWLTIEHGTDRRERIVKLTDEASTNFSEIEESIIAFERRFLERLTVDEQTQLLKLLRKMDREG